MGGTNLSDSSITNGGTFNSYLTNDSGHVVLLRCATANIPSAKANFAVGCQLEDTTTGIWYSNTGTTSSCTFTKASIVATGNKGYYIVEASTNGTTSVNVFGSTNGFAATVTGAYLISNDTTAATITISGTAGATIATIAKGTSSGVMVGATSLTNTALTSAGTCAIVSSSSSGQASVFLTFTVS